MSMQSETSVKRVTGKTVLTWLVMFFGVIFAVNGVFLYLANKTWTGLAAEKAFRLGTKFNEQLAGARAQQALGWTISGTLVRKDSKAHITLQAQDRNKDMLTGMTVTVVLKRPAYDREDRRATLTEIRAGVYQAEVGNVDAGLWNVELTATSKTGESFFSRSQRTLD